jgi:tetratricopeptide (TPR) repeat protein
MPPTSPLIRSLTVVQTLTGLGFLHALCGKEEDPMTPRLKPGWILCFALTMTLHGRALEQGNPANRESLWQEYMNEGKQHRQLRRFADAERSYLAAVNAAQELGSQDIRLAASLNALATAYHEQGRYTEAESAYRRALAVWETARPESENVAICLNNLARLCQDQGRFAQAEPLLKRALAIEEKLLGSGQLERAESLDRLAGVYAAQAFVWTSRGALPAILGHPQEGFVAGRSSPGVQP